MLAAGLPAAHAQTLDIPVFSGAYGTAFYEETARLFEEQRPGVVVNLYGDPRIEDKVRVRIMEGRYPDATFTPRLLWPILIEAGKVRDLSVDLEGLNWEGDAPWSSTFYPGALESWRIKGHVYGVPLNYACWTIFYNRGMFRDHGWKPARTWDEFFALCERIRAGGIAPLSLTGIYGNYPDAFLRAAFYGAAGARGWEALNNLEPGARLDPRYIEAARILQRVTTHYTLKGWEGATHTAAELAFLQGRTAMTVAGSWMLHEMQGKIPADLELGVMNFPVFPGGAADPGTIQTGSDSFFVFATGDPKRERLAVDFLRFMTSRARALAFVKAVDAPVAVRGVPPEAFSPAMRETAVLIEKARESFNMPQVVLQTPAVRQALVDRRIELMTGRLTPEEFGARMEQAAAADRTRRKNPGKIERTHLAAGTAFAAVLVAAWAGLILWSVRRRKRRESANARTSDGSFGTLRGRVAMGFVGPALSLYALFVLLPGIVTFATALVHWDGIGRVGWAGLGNFDWLVFESDGFWHALRNNFFLMVVPPLVVVPVALGLAAMIHRGVWGGGVFRLVFLFPNILGGIAATLLWLEAYEPQGGLVNAGLVALGRFFGNDWLCSFAGHPWLAQSHLYLSLIPIYLWMACGFNLILYLAAMEGIDPQLYEAAEIDGAPVWRQFFTITLPLIWDSVAVSAVFLVIGGLNAFEMIWLLTSQDPETATHTLGTLMVTAMFKEFQIGRAAAIATVMFLLVGTTSLAVMKAMEKERTE